MKRILTFSFIVMAVILLTVGVAKENNMDATLDVSNGLKVIANRAQMAKSAIVDDKMVFSATDFEKAMNLSRVEYITVTKIPDIDSGCLCVGDVVINAGQNISRENLDLLNYRAATRDKKESFFEFKVNGGEYVMRCNLYFLTRENSAPTLDLEDEKIFSVSTHQSVRVYGKVSAYDVEGDSLRYEVVSYPKNGVLDFDFESGEYSYLPTGTYFGVDSFEYVAVDKYGNYSRSATVNLEVQKLKTDVVYCDMEDHVSHHAALIMTENGIMNGTIIGNSTFFMPDKAVSRVDFVAMLIHAIGEGEVQNVSNTGFDDDADIPQNMKGYVQRAKELGVILGSVDEYGNHLFEPNREISRAEAALIVSKLVNGAVPTVKPTFKDKNEIPAWAQDAIYILNNLGIMSSENGNISPVSNVTRAQAAQMLYALMEYLE